MTIPSSTAELPGVERIRQAETTNMFQPTNPCPICGAEITLAEIEPHLLHAKFEIHGYLCGRCGPIKSLVVTGRHRQFT